MSDKAFVTLQDEAALSVMTCTRTAAGNIVLAQFAGAWIFDTVEQATAWLSRLDQPSRELSA